MSRPPIWPGQHSTVYFLTHFLFDFLLLLSVSHIPRTGHESKAFLCVLLTDLPCSIFPVFFAIVEKYLITISQTHENQAHCNV